ncbi:MAG: 5'-methylthioadenosine/adenosylhomocysteine nucleosidase [Furfurilactobacillus sp.]|jgi:adenosylhomocysteine nucleosidase|uniref:5'-methylthioadenosine/adenosylhomocysteine nucleosidase n=1 Tax=Furfurilactobacillus sp. TaxID=2767911 RepID=UPI0025868E71|nr:5'-methylthioadenosine/adenosylhomocysteine nucleosidase [Furfurilactobacillus sp.]MCH4011029.1 5'-methylthioadenosine/adenosylhomocysteine nucleosidase [Furfurilactobacillus sp.]MCH4036921.1 5'-methylthioadenosine/adenosylhomocysteine nucleosidase [Furfurilactobacillus sp.]MCH4114133.1 5'-methylthioadenosine/adenosylhomocysteine nucleosidase [Furfurilactobacillus sp.]MCH4133044.1 5'-methylthioadenosine/adenosylhomocysteine nucleosidase [Furfurilactobacillus sp.]MCI1340921.1 5'-methylthioad
MKFGILCAMDEEIKELKAQLSNETTTTVGKVDFFSGQINGNDVVLVRSGIGKVEAGLTTALLITNFDVDVVINSGSAGGIGTGLTVGDVVIADETAYWDVDATAFDYVYGQLPQQPARFKASDKWADEIIKAADATGLAVKRGLIVTGDSFVASDETIKDIKTHFPEAVSCEMEGAAVGQVAHQFDVPYLVIRAMSDTGNGDAGVSFDEFIIEAGKRSANMLLNFFEREAK